MISPGGWKERHKDEDVVPPKKPLSKRVLLEMYAGKRQIQKLKYALTMPTRDFRQFELWVNDWMAQ